MRVSYALYWRVSHSLISLVSGQRDVKEDEIGDKNKFFLIYLLNVESGRKEVHEYSTV